MTTQYAQTQQKHSRIASEFGEQLARKWFGDEVVDQLPRYARGANKGKPKGYVKWVKVTRGGWKQSGLDGKVLYPNTILNKWIELPEWGCDPQIIAGEAP